MTRVVFVTGTDTGVGKTVVTAALAAAYSGVGRRVCVVKPAQTGVALGEAGDLEEVRRLAGPVPTFEPARLPDPLAPDLAARVAGMRLPSLAQQQAVIVGAAESAGADGVVLVEGAGGVTVRLGDGWSLLDLATSVTTVLLSTVVVVARPGLGTLNHSLLTVEAVRAAGLTLAGLVLGSWPEDPALVERLNREELPRLTGAPLLGAVPLGAPALRPVEFQARAGQWFEALP